jgi:hypothetical protein
MHTTNLIDARCAEMVLKLRFTVSLMSPEFTLPPDSTVLRQPG